jgi:hypothetical protein
MIRRVSHTPTWIMQLLVLLLILFLLLPVAALFGLGLYYTLGILLVADTSQMVAALGKEAGIAPALLQTPLIAIAVSLMATGWGLALSMLWRNWIAGRYHLPLLLSALPFLLPRFGLGALFLLACLKLAQWGGNALGLGLVALSQAAVAAPLVAGILCIGWRRVDPAWREAALEAPHLPDTQARHRSWRSPCFDPVTGRFLSRQCTFRRCRPAAGCHTFRGRPEQFAALSCPGRPDGTRRHGPARPGHP